MKKIIIGIVFVLMIGWALYDFLVPEQQSIKDSDDELVETTTNDPDESLKEEDESQEDAKENGVENEAPANEGEENAPFTEEIVGLEIGNLAPDFQLTTLDGDEVSLSDFRGKRVLINFWATWCPPCRAEMPDIEEFYLNHDVVVLAVNLTDEEPSTQQVQDFVDEFYLSFPILLDETLSVATTYEIHPIPTSFLVDSNGVIQNKAFGALTYEQMVDGFEKMH